MRDSERRQRFAWATLLVLALGWLNFTLGVSAHDTITNGGDDLGQIVLAVFADVCAAIYFSR